MELETAINLRQAVREFKKEPVEEDQLAALVAAGSAAPVSRGHFGDFLLTVITDRTVIDALEESDTGHPFYGAPAVIMISSTRQDQSGCLSAGMIAENIELKAVELGLVTCSILGIVKTGIEGSAKARDLLGLPAEFTPLFAVAVGKPAHQQAPRHFVTNRLRSVTIAPQTD